MINTKVQITFLFHQIDCIEKILNVVYLQINMLKNKNILLAITGGIAAYKCPELCRLLVKNEAKVQVVMTESARHFVSNLVMSNLSNRLIPASKSELWSSMEHIEFARWSDIIVVSPATANIIAKIAHGFADDIITCTILASKSPIVCCPSMNTLMYNNPATQHNISILKSRSIYICGPACGNQACGEYGLGRMSEPIDIVSYIVNVLNEKQNITIFTGRDALLTGKMVIITCGPTREFLDPVRFISNRSSGKMGYALASAALHLGANVVLISGPCTAEMPTSLINCKDNLLVRHVTSAIDMQKEVMDNLSNCDVFIGCAAVVDFRPAKYDEQKIKKVDGQNSMTVEFEANPDIIANVAKMKESLSRLSMVVGFAADTTNIEENARKKLYSKGVDMICANDCSVNSKYGFDSDFNELILIDQNYQTTISGSKETLAYQLFEVIAKRCQNNIPS
ncbi:hypothetical protein GJ496_009144 [Pomphorhynchus laevis]|nr:hypothetical protein GJ496_009144 [Pomphorhynchus laevis]